MKGTMKMFQDFFNTRYKEQLQVNYKNIYTDVKKNIPSEILKLEKYAEKWDKPFDFCKEAVLNKDEWALRTFAKDPGRQNIAEKLQAEYSGIKLLPNSNKIKFTDGTLETRSIDGLYQDYLVYMKLIRQNGGQPVSYTHLTLPTILRV